MSKALTREVTGTTVVVTGAAGGIGGAVARQALAAGVNVVLGDLRPEPLEELAAEWGADRVGFVAGDLRDPATSAALVAEATSRFGRLDSVVANAAVGSFGGILDHDDRAVELMVDVNLLGTIWLVRAAVAEFRRAGGGGDIVIVASVAGMLIGGGKEAVYAATKGAQINLATALDRELRHEGIRTTAIAPAGVNTAFAAADGRFGDTDPADGPFLDPGDVAGAILHTLGQPRRMRTELWTMWSLAENH